MKLGELLENIKRITTASQKNQTNTVAIHQKKIQYQYNTKELDHLRRQQFFPERRSIDYKSISSHDYHKCSQYRKNMFPVLHIRALYVHYLTSPWNNIGNSTNENVKTWKNENIKLQVLCWTRANITITTQHYLIGIIILYEKQKSFLKEKVNKKTRK